MLKLFLLFSHSIFLASSCPTGWLASSVDDGKCYLFVTQKQTWLQAESYCKKAAPDGHLASVTSAFENTDIFGLGKRQCSQYWIGLQSLQKTRDFNWVDGKPFVYSNWDADQPGSDDSNGCAAVNGQGNAKWIAVHCAETSCFFCESYPSSEETTPSTPMTDCYDWYHIGGARNDGVYQIRPSGSSDIINVWCDMTTDGGGWTVIHRRIDDTLSFYNKTWDEYKNGFNNGLDNNLWLGNDNINILTTNFHRDYRFFMRADIWGDRGPGGRQNSNGYWWQKTSSFWIDSEANNYTLHANTTVEGNASISGDPNSGINYNIGRPFSTIDKSHDNFNGGCDKAPYESGGWWLNYCTRSALNGKYIPSKWDSNYGYEWGIDGNTFINPVQSRMMIRRET